MARFTDFNFKLLVIEQLMYVDRTLTPEFSFFEYLKGKGISEGPWEYAHARGLAYKVVPEVREHFEALEISDELLAGVEELCVDGGNQVYQECAPIWDGEDDLFDVGSLDDLALVPNLRRVIGSEFLGEEGQEALRSRGIEAD